MTAFHAHAGESLHVRVGLELDISGFDTAPLSIPFGVASMSPYEWQETGEMLGVEGRVRPEHNNWNPIRDFDCYASLDKLFSCVQWACATSHLKETKGFCFVFGLKNEGHAATSGGKVMGETTKGLDVERKPSFKLSLQ